MSNKRKEHDARKVEAQRRANERATVRAETTGRGVKRFSSFVGNWFHMLFSNLRFSLTLRIALHYSGQVLGTTLFVLLVFSVVFGVAQIPSVDSAMDALAAQKPANGYHYTVEQLTSLPVNEARLLQEPLPDDANGFFQTIQLAFSEFSVP